MNSSTGGHDGARAATASATERPGLGKTLSARTSVTADDWDFWGDLIAAGRLLTTALLDGPLSECSPRLVDVLSPGAKPMW